MTKKRRADRLISAYAILKDGRCTTCGAINDTLEPGHYFGRTRQSVRWDVRNVYCQCASCNAAHENDPEPLRRVILGRLGQEEFEALEMRSGDALIQPDMQDIITFLRTVVSCLPRFKKLSPQMQRKVLNAGKFSNRELIRAIHGDTSCHSTKLTFSTGRRSTRAGS